MAFVQRRLSAYSRFHGVARAIGVPGPVRQPMAHFRQSSTDIAGRRQHAARKRRLPAPPSPHWPPGPDLPGRSHIADIARRTKTAPPPPSVHPPRARAAPETIPGSETPATPRHGAEPATVPHGHRPARRNEQTVHHRPGRRGRCEPWRLCPPVTPRIAALWIKGHIAPPLPLSGVIDELETNWLAKCRTVLIWHSASLTRNLFPSFSFIGLAKQALLP